MRSYKKYANEVVRLMGVSGQKRKKIISDILDMLNERSIDSGEVNPEEIMGPAIDLARELSGDDQLKGAFEYRSETEILGLPLIHITRKKHKVAKGIIAFGDIAVGIFAVGGLAIGLVPIGGFSLGLISFGGFAIGYSAFGGLAIGYDIALGGLAIANELAVGGLAISNNIAVGGQVQGRLMLFRQGFTPVLREHIAYHVSDRQPFFDKLGEWYPELSDFKTWILSFLN